jgi:hypothetical protein
LLPGTRLRADSAAHGMRFMEEPPYWVLSTSWLSEESMFRAVAAMEEAFGVEAFVPIVPSFDDPAPGLTGFIDSRRPGELARLSRHPERLASSVTILCGAGREELARLAGEGRSLAERLPYNLWQIVVESDAELPDRADCERLSAAFSPLDRYFDRHHYYNLEYQQGFGARLFLLSGSPKVLDAALAEEEPWFDIAVDVTEELLDLRIDLLEGRPVAVMRKETLGFSSLRKLVGMYEGLEGLIRERT